MGAREGALVTPLDHSLLNQGVSAVSIPSRVPEPISRLLEYPIPRRVRSMATSQPEHVGPVPPALLGKDLSRDAFLRHDQALKPRS